MPFTRRTFLTQSSLFAAASALLPNEILAQTGAPAGASDAYATTAVGKVERVTLLGSVLTPLKFRQTAEALVVTMPPTPTSSQPYTLRIEGTHPLGGM